MHHTTQTAPLITIGMPVYNGEKFVRDALDALTQQTLPNFELIISDNASTDGTGQICMEYAERDQRIIYYRQKNNIGAIANFQFVLDHANSDLFMWAAHDDVWSKTFLYDAQQLLTDKSIDFIFPSFKLQSITQKKELKINTDIFKFIESENSTVRLLHFMTLHHLSHKCNIVYSLFRTTFIKKALGIQDIGNDGALGAVILNLGRGLLLNDWPFSKRYEGSWPGAKKNKFFDFLKLDKKEFIIAKKSALNLYSELFPEYYDDIKYIFVHYREKKHKNQYLICNISNIMTKWIAP